MKTKTLNIPDVEFAYINALKNQTGKGRCETVRDIYDRFVLLMDELIETYPTVDGMTIATVNFTKEQIANIERLRPFFKAGDSEQLRTAVLLDCLLNMKKDELPPISFEAELQTYFNKQTETVIIPNDAYKTYKRVCK